MRAFVNLVISRLFLLLYLAICTVLHIYSSLFTTLFDSPTLTEHQHFYYCQFLIFFFLEIIFSTFLFHYHVFLSSILFLLLPKSSSAMIFIVLITSSLMLLISLSILTFLLIFFYEDLTGSLFNIYHFIFELSLLEHFSPIILFPFYIYYYDSMLCYYFLQALS